WDKSQSRHWLGFDTDQTDRVTTKMGVPHHRGLRRAHPGPTLHWGVILIDGRHHHFANIKRFFAAGVGFVGHDIADPFEPVIPVAVLSVRMNSHVSINGIGGRRLTGEALAWSYVGVFIMAQQQMAGLINVLGPILRLPIEAHDAVVTADS